ncbi:MAG: TonB-dependent receptor [Bacteroidota bacterium]
MKLIITYLFFLCSLNLVAQTVQVSGSVQSKNEPLAYANVQVKALQIGTTTNESGYFELELPQAGEYTLSVTYVGFEAQQRNLKVTESGSSTINFELVPNISLGEVVVTGTMRPTFVSTSPIKVDVVTEKQLDTYLPSAASSLVESIQLVNGVQEVVACGICYTNNISINGLAGAYTAILMDGTPIYGNLAAVYGLNGIPNMIIERFEIIKGPSSTLYGSEAVAGVINIITKDPESQPLISLDIMGTSRLENFGNVALAPKIGKSSGYIGLNYGRIRGFDDFNFDGFGDRINLDRYALFSKWNIHRESGRKFTMAGKYYYEDRRNGVEQFLTGRNYRALRGDNNIYGESIYTNRAELFGTYEFDTTLDLKVDFSLSDHRQDSYYGSDYYQAQQQIAFANLLWNSQYSKHDVLVGLTARYNAYDDNTVATEILDGFGATVNAPNNQFIPGVFVQDEFRPNASWTLLGGLRLDHYQSHGLIFAPRLSVKHKASDWTTFRTNFGTGFRVVNLFTEDHAFITGQRRVEITEALRPEQSYNASFNLNQVYALAGSGTIDVEAFYTHFTNKILPDYDTPGKIIYANSTGFARTIGIGLSINHSFSAPWSLNVGLNLQRATETETDENGNIVTRAIEFAPRFSGVFSANYTWKKHALTFAYTANLTGNMALPEVFDLGVDGELLSVARATESTPFSVHDFQVNKTVNDALSLYGGVQNIFNFRQSDSPLVGYNDPNAATGFSDFFDTSYAYAPNIGREVYLGIKWNW